MAVSDATHPTYRAHRSDWQTTRRMLTGDGVEAELNQRYFEHSDHFAQRQKDADFTPWSRHLMSRLAGMLFQRADDVERDLGPLTEDDLETAGAKGEDYSVLLLQHAEKLLTYNCPVVVLNPATGLHVHSPLALRHWGTDQEGVPFATIQSSRVTSPGPEERGEQETTYVVYRPDGFETYVDGGEGEDDMLVNAGTWTDEEGEQRPFFVLDGQPVPPVLRIEMPWEAKLGLLVARKHRAIYRMTSRRDFQLSAAMNGLIQLGVGDDVQMEDIIKEEAKSGEKFLPYNSEYGAHQGLEFPTAGAELGTEVLDAKKKDLARIAYAEMEKGARSATSATEAMIKERGAAAAALSVVAETMSDAEQRILSLWAQASDFRQFAGPNASDPGVSASWPTDYSDVVGGDEDDLAQMIFGSRLPADAETATSVLMDTYEEEGYSPDEAALLEEVESTLDRSAQSGSTAGGFLG
jgi:hypothetical protein